MLDAFYSVFDVFFIFDFCERKKKIVFHTRELKYKIVFYKLKTQSSLHMYAKFYSSRICKTHKNFQFLIKLLWKGFKKQFFLFSLVHLKLEIIFNHLWSFYLIITNRILWMHFLRKWRSNIYLNKKLLKKRNFQKSFKWFVSKTKYFIHVRLFLNFRFDSVTVDFEIFWYFPMG